MQKEKTRLLGLDLVKAIAIVFVVCVHFFLNTKYYQTPLSGLNLIVQTVVRWLFVSCVPLFILSTGFLSTNKTVSKDYFVKIVRVLIPYVVISVICLIVREADNPSPFDLRKAVFSIFNFTADPYSWYVNMFIGLYLLAPFLNTLLNQLEQKKTLLLLGLLVVLISLPLTFDPILRFETPVSYIYFPDFWQSVYPIVYYVLGFYIARYRPAVSKTLCFGIVLLMLVFQTAVLLLAQPYLKNNWLLTDYGSVFVMLQSTALFLLLYDTDIKYTLVRRAVTTVSSVTLEVYLFSFLADSHLYPYFYKLDPAITQQSFFRKYFVFIVSLVFILSFIPAFLLHFLYEKASQLLTWHRSSSPAEK